MIVSAMLISLSWDFKREEYATRIHYSFTGPQKTTT
jgi:hypothetical protein